MSGEKTDTTAAAALAVAEQQLQDELWRGAFADFGIVRAAQAAMNAARRQMQQETEAEITALYVKVHDLSAENERLSKGRKGTALAEDAGKQTHPVSGGKQACDLRATRPGCLREGVAIRATTHWQAAAFASPPPC
jgi:hypothetical protein